MELEELKELQQPLKQQYRDEPQSALLTLSASGSLDDQDVSCSVQTGAALVKAGLHPASGGDGSLACSGNMLLEALVACAGVTLASVATNREIPVNGGTITAEGDLDFRGTMAVGREAPVGFSAIRLRFDLNSDASPDQIAELVELTERYCVVLQTLANTPKLSVDAVASAL